MTVFELGLSSIFADRNLAKDAIYVSKSGERKKVRVIIRAPDLHVRFEGALVHTSSITLEVRVCDSPHIEIGDKFIINEQTFSVQAEPKGDSEHLVWQVGLSPVTYK